MFIRFDRKYQRDGQQTHTDRHTPHDGVGRACIASRGKNTSYAPGCQRRAVHTGKLRLHENREKNCHIFAIFLFYSAESKDGSTFRANVNRICLKNESLRYSDKKLCCRREDARFFVFVSS